MSGAKRITVDEAVWNEAQRAAGKLAEVHRELPGMLENIRRQSQADLDRLRTAVVRRQDQAEQALAALSEHTRQLESWTNTELRKQLDALQDVRDETTRTAEQLRREIGRERSERQARLHQLSERIDELKGGRDRASEAARSIYQDAWLMHDVIEGMPHERFAPGRLDRLHHRLTDASRMVHEQEPAYSLGTVQQLYHDLSELRADVQLLEFEWLHTQAEALAALHRAAEVARANAEVTVPDLPGAMVDVDHWTDGGLSELRAEIDELTRRATGEHGPMDVAELRKIIRQVVPGYEARLDSLAERAGRRVVASQFRANTAEQVIDALTEQGFGFVEETYEGEDFRQAHYSKLRHHDDSEVVVEIAPDGDTGMTIRILSYDDERSQARRAQRARDLTRALRQGGVPIGEATDTGAEPTPEERDFKRIRALRRGTG
ncbi:hypothetical protein [Nonomuraea sp. NPDC049625]|uniref:hypothetical protein n=1 Tax=Nonomuraea sp. NPDC049625 TaxID=3155775 RepID=UPI0034403FCC